MCFHLVYPNLLVNGTSGIAVGMATNIPPHNSDGSLSSGVVKIIDNQDRGRQRYNSGRNYWRSVKGPDFPTGSNNFRTVSGIEEAYSTGHG